MAEQNRESHQGTHDGHRQRILQRWEERGLERFSDLELLEFLLTFSIPRKDTKPLAQQLLEAFGSLEKVFAGDRAQLLRLKGIGPKTAAMIELSGEIWRRAELARSKKPILLRSTKSIGEYLMAQARGLREERAWILCLDAGYRFLQCRELCSGAVNAVNLPCRRVVEEALLNNASLVVLAHNHSSGNLLPTLEDLEYTRSLMHALAMVDVKLLDHMILGATDFVSLRGCDVLDH